MRVRLPAARRITVLWVMCALVAGALVVVPPTPAQADDPAGVTLGMDPDPGQNGDTGAIGAPGYTAQSSAKPQTASSEPAFPIPLMNNAASACVTYNVYYTCGTASDSGVLVFATGSRSPDPRFLSLAGRCTGSVDTGDGLARYSGIRWSYIAIVAWQNYTTTIDTNGDEPGGEVVVPIGVNYNAPPIIFGGTGNAQCLLPALFSTETYTCPYYYDWESFGPFDNPTPGLVPNDGRGPNTIPAPDGPDAGRFVSDWGRTFNSGVSRVPGWSGGVTGAPLGDLGECAGSPFTKTFARGEWGRYHLDLQARLMTCRVRVPYQADQATGQWPPARSLGCGDAGTLDRSAYYTLFCAASPNADGEVYTRQFTDGYFSGGAGHWNIDATRNKTFTTADCPQQPSPPPPTSPGDAPLFQQHFAYCPVPRSPTLDGRVGFPFTVIGDGNRNDAVWPVAYPRTHDSSGREVVRYNRNVGETRFFVKADSSPWRGEEADGSGTRVPVNHEDNFFDGTYDFNASWDSGLHGSARDPQEIAWYRSAFARTAADERPRQWVSWPWWRWWGRVRMLYPQGLSFDWVSGVLTPNEDSVYRWNEQWLRCSGGNLVVEVARGRLAPND